MRIRFALLSSLAFVGALGCWSAAEPVGESSVMITNASSVELTDVHVTTGPGDEIVNASIAANATTPVRHVDTVHENVVVTAKVGSQSVSFIPIEGFAGFNRLLPSGPYLVRLTVHAENDGIYRLEAVVTALLPD